MFINKLKDGCYKCDWNASDRSINPMPICLCRKECINSNQYEFYIKGKSMTESMAKIQQLIVAYKKELDKPISPMQIYENLDKQYSVSLRNSDSSADNNKVELIMQREIMSCVRGLKQGLRRPDKLLLNDAKEFDVNSKSDIEKVLNYFQSQVIHVGTSNGKQYVDVKSVIKIIQYFNRCDLRQDNNKVEQSTTDEELMSKIEDMVAELFSDRTSGSFCSCYEGDLDDCYPQEVLDIRLEFGVKLKDLFKTHRNTVSTATNQKNDNLLSKEDLLSKIAFKNSLRHHVGKLVAADQELDQIVENIVNFFVDTVNPVFRALNDSNEQSIIK